MMGDIEKIISQSSRQELIEFLGDNDFDLDSAILLYRKTDGEYGFKKMENSSIVALIGMLRVICKYWEDFEIQSFIDEAMEDE